MHRTIRVLRIVLPIAFVGFILLIVLNWTKSKSRRDDHALGEPVVSDKRPKSDTPRALALEFEDTQTVGGRIVSRIRAGRVVSFSSGWNTLENVQLTIFRPKGLTYELSCPEAQFNSETKEAEAKGGVRVVSNDGMEFVTAEIKYDGSRLMNDIPVQFKIDRWSGNAGGLDLDVAGETLRLFKNMAAATTPAIPGEAPMTINSAEGTFRRQQNDVTFTQNVVMTRGADRLTAERLVGYASPDRKHLMAMESKGSVVVVLGENAASTESFPGRKVVQCDSFFSEVAPNGEMKAVNILGEGRPARVDMDGPPKRDITAGYFRITLASGVVSEIRAENDVYIHEQVEVLRELRAARMTVNFDPATKKAVSSYMEDNVRYKDPKNEANAIQAHYDVLNDRILLSAKPGFDPTVVADGQTIKAKQIEFSPKGGTAKATGDVIAQLVSRSSGATADATALFPSGKPVFVNADTLTMRQATKLAIFNGNVRAWQDTNTLLAQEMHVQGTGQVVTAKGNVRTVLYNAAGDRKGPVRTKSDQFIARKLERRVDLVGAVNIEDEQGILNSDKATLSFDANRKLERVDAETNVTVVEKPTSRKGTGDKATYHVARKMIFVTGSPASVSAPNGSLLGQQIAFDLNRNKVEIISPTGKTEGTYRQQ